MKEDVVKKHVKDLGGLLREIEKWEKKPIWDVYHERAGIYHDAVIFVFGRLFQFFNFNAIFFGPRAGLDAVVEVNGQWLDLEFEVFSSVFKKDHLKNIAKGEKVLVVCWKDDWENPPENIEIIELKQFWEKLESM